MPSIVTNCSLLRRLFETVDHLRGSIPTLPQIPAYVIYMMSQYTFKGYGLEYICAKSFNKAETVAFCSSPTARTITALILQLYIGRDHN